MNLYIKKQTDLYNILAGLTTYEHTGNWDGNCIGNFITSNYYLSIQPTKKLSFSDILVTKKSENKHTSESNNDCNGVIDKLPIKKYQIFFNGTKYNVPEQLKSSLLN